MKTAITPQRVLLEVQYRRGIENGIKAKELVTLITGEESTASDERWIRYIVTRLRNEGFPILATPESGYYWPVNAGEIHVNCQWLKSRAMTHLKMMAKLKKIGVPLVEGQLSLPIPQLLPIIPEIEKASSKEAGEEEETAILANVPKELYEMVQAFGKRVGKSEEEILQMALSAFLTQNQPVKFVGELQ